MFGAHYLINLYIYIYNNLKEKKQTVFGNCTDTLSHCVQPMQALLTRMSEITEKKKTSYTHIKGL